MKTKKKHRLDFPGSQAVMWDCQGDSGVAELCERTRIHGKNAYMVMWPFYSTGPVVSYVACADELRPIGPVARELLRRR